LHVRTNTQASLTHPENLEHTIQITLSTCVPRFFPPKSL
jgi:hypothetical protein